MDKFEQLKIFIKELEESYSEYLDEYEHGQYIAITKILEKVEEIESK